MFDWKKLGQIGPEEPQDPFAGMDPMVVEHIKKKMGGVDAAQNQANNAQIAGVAASAADSMSNAFNQPVALRNRMQDLGKAPAMLEGRQQKTDLSGMQRSAQHGLDVANSDRDQALQTMLAERKAQLAAQVAAKRQGIEDERWSKDFNEKFRHNKAMEGKTKEVDPMVAAVRAEQLAKLQRDAKQDEDSRNVPGYTRTGEVLQAPDEAKNARDAIGIANNIKGGIETLKTQMDTNGNFELGGSGGSAMSVTANDLRLQLKELNKLGVLNGPDLALMLQQIPDTEGIGQLFTRKSTTDAQLQQVLENINRKIETGMSAKGYKAKGAPAAAGPKAGDVMDGYTFIGGDPSNPASWKK
jgi:hypothetical protein